MWQSIAVLLVVGVALAAIIRHYARIVRSKSPTCSGCPGCGAAEIRSETGFKTAKSTDAGGPPECCCGQDSGTAAGKER